jgi:hypothetical protein
MSYTPHCTRYQYTQAEAQYGVCLDPDNLPGSPPTATAFVGKLWQIFTAEQNGEICSFNEKGESM